MKASEIRRRFLDYFQLRAHERVPSASLVPADDPTLLFTNAGMVQFKKVFLGAEELPYKRAVTAQKCVRAGGKHNDLEQVGITAWHHTFFEMLGNFSFGDYFKSEAVLYAWEFITNDLGLEPERVFATVHHTDDEAYQLWQEVAGLDPARILRLGDEENFWQMADTGPCGPCSELHYDLRPTARRSAPTPSEFEILGETGEIIELWNLVFMQFDRDGKGKLSPLPAPSIDTGAGLERLAMVLQGVNSNYQTDLFQPLLERVAQIVGREYQAEGEGGVSYRVLADHARAVAFLLADGVLPSNEGRGYVLRRILRRAVRHAWLLGLREPALGQVVAEVVLLMADQYPELADNEPHILKATGQEEERFLVTIEEGMERFDQIAPPISVQPTSGPGGSEAASRPTIPGRDAFKLYDTFGFPLDLTQVIANERGYVVDEKGFEDALEEQRVRSRTDRAESDAGSMRERDLSEWTVLVQGVEQEWVGWNGTRADTRVIAMIRQADRVGLILRDNPFYAEAGGQLSDVGVVEGEGWRVSVDEVRKISGRTAVSGKLEGEFPEDRSAAGAAGGIPVGAQVLESSRHDGERNHTATHLLHAALRRILGGHVTQRGSLVAPDRLRFDFSHPQPLTAEEISAVEREVNEAIWADHPVRWEITSRDEAIARGAMALFGEKYGSDVRLVEIPGVSLELCGGNHLRHTGEAGLFVLLRESGVAAGVRRIEALTGPAAFAHLKAYDRKLEVVSDKIKTTKDLIESKIDELLREREEMESLLTDLRRAGSGSEIPVHEAEIPSADGSLVRYRAVRMRVKDADDARAFGDAFRERESAAVAALATESPDGKLSLFVFVTDDLVGRGVKAGALVGEIAAVAGGRGGGRPHMAQGGVENPERLDEALRSGESALRQALETAPA